MLARLRYILPVIVLLAFGGLLISDEVQKPDLTSAIQGLQQTLLQLQKEIKDLQSSVKELSRNAKKAALVGFLRLLPRGSGVRRRLRERMLPRTPLPRGKRRRKPTSAAGSRKM